MPAAALALACTLVCGCDFLRSIAGRPTSRQIESAVAERAAAEREAALQDSIRKADAARAVEDSIARANAQAPAPEVKGGHGYYVVVGVFESAKNAQKKVNQCGSQGLTATYIRLRSGKYGVIVNPSATEAEGEKMLSSLKARKLCSKGAWLLYI